MSTQSYDIPQQITSVRLSATSNVSGNYYNGNINNGIGATLTSSSNSTLTVDGIIANLGDRILLSMQTNTNENGIYVVMSPGSSSSKWVLQRSPDFQSLEQLKLGQYFSVNAGNTLAGNMYVLIEPLPYSIGSSGMSFINVSAGGSGSGPFLRIANNLSDLGNQLTSYHNFGLGNRTVLSLTDSDFIAGNYSLTNPCPNIIGLNCSTPGNTLQLPSAQGPQAFELLEGPEIINNGTQRVNVVSFLGIPQTPSLAKSDKFYLLQDNSTTGGLWDVIGKVTSIDGQTGQLSFIAGTDMSITDNLDGTITFASTSSSSTTLQEAYNNSSPKQINISSGNLNLIQGQLGVNIFSSRSNASFQVDSTTQGTLPFPRMSNSDEAQLESALVSADKGMCVYNTDFNTVDTYNGTNFSNILTTSTVLPGTNVSITNSAGTLTINASGGTGPVTSGQASFVVNANPTQTTFSSPGDTKPILIDPTKFHSIVATNFSNFVSGANTPTTQLLETSPRKIFFSANMGMKMNTGTQNTYQFYLVIRTSPSSTTTTTYQTDVSLTPLSTGFVSVTLGGILPMNQNNSIEIWVTNLGGTDPIQVVDISAQAWDLTQQGYASTDQLIQGTNNWYLTQNGGITYQNVSGTPTFGHLAQFNSAGGQLIDSGLLTSTVLTTSSTTNNLSQGSNNWYLSQNGGTTYQNVSGSTTAGNVAVFNSAGGQLIDLGLVAGNANLISTTQASTNVSFYPLFVGSTSNSYQGARLSTGLSFNPFKNSFYVGDTQTIALNGKFASVGASNSPDNSFNWYTPVDQYPIAQILCYNHDNASLSFDAYYSGAAWTSSSSTNNFQITKGSGQLSFNAANNIAAGSAITWTKAIIIDSSANVNLPLLTASTALVLDGSKNIASLAYTSANTASTLVSRDGSGNFSAGTITASLSGNATTATTATNSTNVATTQVSTNASFFPLMVSSSTNGNQAADLSTGFTFNPSTHILTTTGLNLSGLTASQAVVTDSSKNLASLAYTNANTASTLVQRDGSGNFSAGTITATLSGNATTATTATNATNIGTTNTTSVATYPLIYVSSSSSGNQAALMNQYLLMNFKSATQVFLDINSSSLGEAGTNMYRKDNTTYCQHHFYTGGSTNNFSFGLRGGDNDFHIYDELSGVDRLQITSVGNIGINGNSFGSAQGVIFIKNSTLTPSGNPSSGGILYTTGGALHYLSQGGTNTTVAPNDPHCPVCSSDFGFEWENEKYGGNLRVCMVCLSKDLGSKPYIRWNENKQ